MNVDKILEVLAKGMTLVESLTPAYNAIMELLQKFKSGEEITKEDLDKVSAILDEQLTLFNAPLPPPEG